MKLLFVTVFVGVITYVSALQNEYIIEDPKKDKIIGFSHLEDFLTDLQNKIAAWTKSFRDAVIMKPAIPQPGGVGKRLRRQTTELEKPKPSIKDWLIVHDFIDGFNFIRKQLSEMVERTTMIITGVDNSHNQQLGFREVKPNEPYVPILKEFRDYLRVLQTGLTRWSNRIQTMFQPQTTPMPMLIK